MLCSMPVEQPKLDWTALMEEALTAPGNLGDTYNRFHNYSLTNNLLFLMQGVREPVASYKRWQSLGRHVIKGARAKEVIVPLLVNETSKPHESVGVKPEDETEEQKRERVARLIGFKLVRGVFAYSDTDGPEIPPKAMPRWDMNKALDTLKITRVAFSLTNGNVHGYSVGREIAINPMATNPEKTMLHEVGHIVLGHTVTTSLSEYGQHRGIMEFGAESTAYLAGHELGIIDEETASASRAYIRHWLHDEQPSERNIRFVFAATDQILKAGRVEESEA